jgi:hypothetical protein
MVGVYLTPPQNAVGLCVDEKSQSQALDRMQPGLPLKPGRCGTSTHVGGPGHPRVLPMSPNGCNPWLRSIQRASRPHFLSDRERSRSHLTAGR